MPGLENVSGLCNLAPASGNSKVDEKNPVSYILSLERKIHLHGISRWWWIFFFDTTPKLDKWSFLKVSCNVQPETTSMHFSYSVTLKSNDLPCTLMDFFFKPMHDSVTSCTGRLENTGSLIYADLANADTFNPWDIFKNLTFTSITACATKQARGLREPTGLVFQNSSICLKAWIFSLATNIVSCPLCLFSRKCLPSAQLWITVACRSFFQARKRFHKTRGQLCA